MSAKPTPPKTIDALPAHWTDRLPAAAQPYARLSRLDRPIGWQLLFLPCLMGIALAETQEGFWGDDATLAIALLIGAIAMRGAGCTWNDILDRDLDAKVERTRSRPIPSGQVSIPAAFVFLAALSLIGLTVLVQMNRFTIAAGR